MGCRETSRTPLGQLVREFSPPARVWRTLALLSGAALFLALLARAQPTSIITYRVQLDFGQRFVGFDTCDQPAWNVTVVEGSFQLKRLPANTTLYLHLYSIDRCAAYFSVYVNDFIIARERGWKIYPKPRPKGSLGTCTCPCASLPTTSGRAGTP